MNRKITIENLQEYAKHNGGVCLSYKYINSKMPVEWQCGKGHIWNAPWKGMYDGRWCKQCYSGSRRLNISIAKQIASKRGGECLSIEYKNRETKLKWQCRKGHIWKSRLDDVKNHNQWCPECALEKTRLSINDCHKVAKRFGGKCLSTKYVNAKSKITWQCKNEHIWSSAAGNAIHKNKWCPRCRDKSQNVLAKNVEQVLNLKVEQKYRGFKWLDTINGGRQEIDIFVPNIKLAIEYDGQGHFYPVNFGGCDDNTAQKIFEKTKILDRLKNKKIKQHSHDVKYFIRFSYKENIYDIDYIKNKLHSIGAT